MEVANFRSVFEKEYGIVGKLSVTDDMLKIFVAEDKSGEMKFMTLLSATLRKLASINILRDVNCHPAPKR